jgi:hypothetical protein
MGSELPESVDVKDFPSRWTTKDKWAGVDIMLYKWFLNRTETARRYLVLEYDCMCTMPIAHAYAGVWNADVACAKFVRRWTHPLWHWFSPESLAKLDPEDRPIAAGVVPYVGALYSHRALEAILDNVTSNDAFAELRLGTAISKAGLDVTRLPRELRRTIQWDLFTGGSKSPRDLSRGEVEGRRVPCIGDESGAGSPGEGVGFAAGPRRRARGASVLPARDGSGAPTPLSSAVSARER